jgi:hypothetical protein
MKRQRLGFRNVRSPEPLESRTMLAGGGFLPFTFMGRQIFAFSPPDAGQDGTAFGSSAVAGRRGGHEHEVGAFSSHSADSITSFTATLTDSAGTATGTATGRETGDTTVSVSVTATAQAARSMSRSTTL